MSTTAELDFLEEAWAESHCEFEHENSTCLHTPVVRFGPSCVAEFSMGCRTVQFIYEQRRSRVDNKCDLCQESCRDCWRVYPL